MGAIVSNAGKKWWVVAAVVSNADKSLVSCGGQLSQMLDNVSWVVGGNCLKGWKIFFWVVEAVA